jgi:hypothetical protein
MANGNGDYERRMPMQQLRQIYDILTTENLLSKINKPEEGN